MNTNEVKDKIREKFSFLTEDWNFSEPKVLTHAWSIEFFYIWENLAVELFFDIREQYVNAFLVKLLDGKIPDCYLFIEGVRYKIVLDIWFNKEFPSTEIKFTAPLKNNKLSQSRIEENIEKYYEMLQISSERIQITPIEEIMK